MKVIMPVSKGYLGAHFGRAEQFVIYEIENGEVKNKTEVGAGYEVRHAGTESSAGSGGCRVAGAQAHNGAGCNEGREGRSEGSHHNDTYNGHSGHHGAIAEFMKSAGADVLIACGIGPGAASDLQSRNIEVISGVSPKKTDDIINDFIGNKIEKSPAAGGVCRHHRN